MNTPVFSPTAKQCQSSRMMSFLKMINETHGTELSDYQALWQWSIDNKSLFWQAVWSFHQLKSYTSAISVLEQRIPFYKSQWFDGLTFNFAENLLTQANPEQLAVITLKESGEREQYTYQQLTERVHRFAHYLKQQNVQSGDVVAGILPNGIEALIAALASSQIGATWTCCSPDFGVEGIVDRLGQTHPKVLVTINGYRYLGKTHDLSNKIRLVIEALPDLMITVVAHFEPSLPPLKAATMMDFDACLTLSPLTDYTPHPFNHPLYILYSSGTTGTPKCLVHGAGGTLIQHVKELSLHGDVKADDRLFYFTTCGWMMWNWFISGLALGATLVMYDGAPTYPYASRLLEIVEQEQVTHFGCGAKYIETLQKSELSLNYALKHLTTLFSTGSPLSPTSFDFVYQHIKPSVHLASISGGSDIISCFALGNPLQDIYRGELQCFGLGMDVAVLNDDGQPAIDEQGELCCLSPFPSMPIYFFDDPDFEKYHHAYFSRFNNVWAHGDHAIQINHQRQHSLIILGRSDAMLNPGGVRIGSAELYRQIDKMPEIINSIVIGQPWQDDERIVLFVQLMDGQLLDDALIKSIKTTIRQNTTPRHVPALILQVNDIPVTLSGKKVEIAVKQIICGQEVKQLSALKNPESLRQFKDLVQSDS